MEIGDRPKRRLTLLDVMILVAASAIALAAYRAMMPEVPYREQPIVGAWVCLTTLSWALLFLRLKRPRPEFRRLMNRPGEAACVTSLVTTILTGLVCLVGYVRRAIFLGSGIDFTDAPVAGVVATGPALMASWLIMALSRRWRPEIDWIGLLGRALAVGWVLAFLATGLLL